jgi:prophage DNA circulation protein
MDWQERLRAASLESPSGVVITFDYENVSKIVPKKTTAFEFPDFNGTFVQDLGHSGRRYPLRMFFSGDTHDIQAEELEAVLLEVGVSTLTHPVWGVVKVVPFGNIQYRNDLKTAANQTVVDVTFWESIESLFPTNQTDPASNVISAVKEHADAAADAFDNGINTDTEVEKIELKSEYTTLLNNVSSGLESIASVNAEIEKEFNAINDSINNSIDILIGQPLTLAFQTMLLIKAPARAVALISDRLAAYKNLADQIFSSSNPPATENSFQTNDLYASTAVTGSILSVVNNQFITKVDALSAAEEIIVQMDAFTTWRDDNLTNLSIVDTGEMYQQLQEAVALVVGFLIEISFTLKQERRIILQSNHTMIDLIDDLYPDDAIIDDELDFFMQSNDFSGSEILELLRGREIVYYV